jgi:hypothetical protein
MSLDLLGGTPHGQHAKPQRLAYYACISKLHLDVSRCLMSALPSVHGRLRGHLDSWEGSEGGLMPYLLREVEVMISVTHSRPPTILKPTKLYLLMAFIEQ